MAYVDYETKIKQAKQKVKELEDKKKIQDNRIYVPIGHVVSVMLPDVLQCKTETEIRLFLADKLGLGVNNDDEMQQEYSEQSEY